MVWLMALAIALFFEGMMLSVNPHAWQELMRKLCALPASNLRKIGLSMIACAFLITIFSIGFAR